MKQFLSIFMLVSCLFQQTELSELVKFGNFISHYTEHKEANPSLTIADFIDMHYFVQNDNDGDQDKDNKLPFKTHDCTHHLSTPFSVEEPFVFTVDTHTFFKDGKDHKISKQTELPSSYLADIWQPPKENC